jgi:hypothetical protein
MARSPALLNAWKVAAAAAAGWLVLVAVLFQLVPVTASKAVDRIRPVAAHGRGTTAWESAPRVYDELDRRAPGLAREERARVARAILEEAARAELTPLLVLAVIQVESRFDPRAVSPVGAVGLMQLMVPTLREELALASLPAADPFDPVSNVRAGVRYLGRLVVAFPDVELALVAYNAGPGALRRHLGNGGVPERLRAYPREVLREVVRLGPTPERTQLRSTVRLARVDARGPLRGAAGVRGAPGRSGAVALRDRGLRRGPAAGGGAALDAGVSGAGSRPVPALTQRPLRLVARRDACVRLDFALPMSRARARSGPSAVRSSIQS